MKTIKLSEATGPELDYLVARCERSDYAHGEYLYAVDGKIYQRGIGFATGPRYSTDWAQGGPIIERERISVRCWENTPTVHAYVPQSGADWTEGPTPLIAAMRCYVISKLGKTAEVLEELL